MDILGKTNKSADMVVALLNLDLNVVAVKSLIVQIVKLHDKLPKTKFWKVEWRVWIKYDQL